MEGEKLSRKGAWGYAAIEYPVIAVLSGLRGKERDQVIYHEIGHHWFRAKPHWWIDLFGEIMAGGGGRGYSAKKYDKTPRDMPSRAQLLKMARRQSKMLNRKYKI